MQRSYTALMQCNAHKLSLCNAEREPEGDDRIRNGNSSVAVKIGIRKIFGGNGFKLQRVTRNMNGVLGIRKSVTVHIIEQRFKPGGQFIGKNSKGIVIQNGKKIIK